MRTLLRNSLGRSLRTLSEEDRLAAALPIVCGSALAAHCTVAGLDDGRTLYLRVSDAEWLHSLQGMRDVLLRDLAETANVPLHQIELQVSRPARQPAATLQTERAAGSTRLSQRGSRPGYNGGRRSVLPQVPQKGTTR